MVRKGIRIGLRKVKTPPYLFSIILDPVFYLLPHFSLFSVFLFTPYSSQIQFKFQYSKSKSKFIFQLLKTVYPCMGLCVSAYVFVYLCVCVWVNVAILSKICLYSFFCERSNHCPHMPILSIAFLGIYLGLFWHILLY